MIVRPYTIIQKWTQSNSIIKVSMDIITVYPLANENSIFVGDTFT